MPLRINSVSCLGFVTSSLVATALTVHLGVNIVYASPPQYLPHTNSTVTEEAGVFTDFSLFLLCLSCQKEEQGDYVGMYVYLERKKGVIMPDCMFV